jgi:hypothetical protein
MVWGTLCRACGDHKPSCLHLLLVACAIVLPLVPFHQGYVSALTRLPGSLPSFIVLLLPLSDSTSWQQSSQWCRMSPVQR